MFLPPVAWADDEVVGEWNLEYTVRNQQRSAKLAITKSEDGSLAGNWTSPTFRSEIDELKYEDGKLTFRRRLFIDEREMPMRFEGRIEGDTLRGRFDFSRGQFAVTGRRAEAAPAAPTRPAPQQPGQRKASPKGPSIGGLPIPDGVEVLPDLAYREGHERWKLDLAMPAERGDKPRPAIVFVHGGGWRSGDKRRQPFLGPALEFATKGYVSITVNYRLLGHAPFPACIEDVKCAVRWLRAHADEYHVDRERIGAYGNSAGAHLAAMLGLCPPSAGLEGDGPWQDQSSMVQAVVSSATPTSFMMAMNDRAPRPKQQAEAANGAKQPKSRPGGQRRRIQMSEELRRKISPITYVSAEAPPFLIIHDTADRTVSVRHSDQFSKALEKAGAKDVTYLRFDEGFGHGVFMRNIEVTGPAREAFFERTLKGAAK
jgi:acetyl esterase/lipase